MDASSSEAESRHRRSHAQLTRRLPRFMALLAAGIATMVLGASCGSTAKSSKSAAPAAAGNSQSPPPTAPAAPATDTTHAGLSRTMYVNVDAANVRGGPAKDQPIVAKLKFLDAVVMTGATKDDWVEIEMTAADGTVTKAWMHSSLLSASADQAKAVHGTP